MHSFFLAPLLSLKSTISIEKNFSDKKDKHYLIKKAGESLFKHIAKLDQKNLKNIKVFIGPGNNGADGIFLSSLLIKSAYKVDLYLPQKSKKKHEKILKKLDLEKYVVPEKNISCKRYSLVVDALFGTGLNKNIGGSFLKIIDEINSSNSYIISIDIPSGLNSETGDHLNKVVNSNLTCTLISLKKGLFTKSGRDFWESIQNCPLINKKFNTKNYLFSLTDLTKYKIYVSDSEKHITSKKISLNRSFDTHKNSFGKSLIIGGGSNFFGALLISGQSSLKTGTRYVELITTKKHAELLPLHQPEFITSSYDKDSFFDKLNQYNNILIGPGLGQTEWARNVFSKFCNFLKSKHRLKNIILDADALNLLAKNPFKYNKWILTPHPGEAAKLLDIKVNDVQKNRFEIAERLQKKFGGIIVLKGSGTIVQTENNTYVCLHGIQGMATAGMGDCLGGIILSATNLIKNQIDAVLFGTGIHSLSADLIAAKKGTIGILATDVIEKCSSLLNLKN